jgi:RNA polymerase sigma-70 factor (ECF subfamily)
MTPAVFRAKTEDAELVARVRTGDEGACEALIREHAGAMRAVARRLLRCEADSADAVQEAFLAAFRAIDSFAGNAALSSWLHRIVVNCCLARLRSRKRLRTVSLDDLPALDGPGRHVRPASPWAPDAEQQAVRAETRAQVRACIDQLPDAYRTVLVLRDIEELDTDQTAERLGSTPGAVKTRLHRARQALRSLLEPVFGPGAPCRQRAVV